MTHQTSVCRSASAPAVKAAFDAFPNHARARLLEVRALILDVATNSDVIGPLAETLKWGEHAYLTDVTGAGTTVPIAWKPKTPDS